MTQENTFTKTTHKNGHFNKSIHLALQLRDSFDYTEMYDKIVRSINPYAHFKVTPTGTWSRNRIIFYEHEKKDPYYFYKLCAPCKIDFQEREHHPFIMLGFENKFQMKAFLKDFHIDKKQVALCFWNTMTFSDKDGNKLDKNGEYKVVLSVKPIKYYAIKKIKNIIYKFSQQHKNTYGNIHVYSYVQLASSIHDRWIDPFTFEKIRDFKVVYDHFMKSINVENEKQVLSFAKVLHQIDEKAFLYRKNKTHSTSYYISNKTQLDAPKLLSLSKFSTKFYYTYLKDKNPYKIAKYRKDWKSAAEAFILEVFCKQLYKKKQPIDKDDLLYYDNNKEVFELMHPFSSVENFEVELPLKIKELQNTIDTLEFNLKLAKEDVKYYDKKVDERYINAIPKISNVPFHYSQSDEELRAKYNMYVENGTIEMFKMLDKNSYESAESYIKMMHEKEKTAFEMKLFDSYEDDPEYQRCFEKFKEAKKRVKDLSEEIRYSKRDLDRFSKDNYPEIYRKKASEYFDSTCSLFGLAFSKKEVTLFLKNLNLDTKIDPCKFRKIVLDVLLDLKMLSTNYKHDYMKCLCRKYLFSKEHWLKVYRKVKNLICKSSQFLIGYIQYCYTRKSKIVNSCINIYIKGYTAQFAPSVEYFGPPD